MLKEIRSAITRPEFYPHSSPYGDFLIVINPQRLIHEHIVRLGPRVRYFESCVLYTWGMPSSDNFASGHGIIDGRYVIGPYELDKPAIEISLGPCVTLSLKSSGIEVLTDNFGMQVVYHSSKILTNRLHLAALAYKDSDSNIDITAMLTTLHSNHMFCQQYNVFQTPIRGVEVSHPGDKFFVNSKIEVFRKNLFHDDEEVISPTEYHSLVKKGASEIVDNVESILDLGLPVWCDLTGGQDSRVLFAALVSMGRVDSVYFNTKLPTNESINLTRTASFEKTSLLANLDVDIATSLVSQYGGKFFTELDSSSPPSFIYTNTISNLGRRRSQVFGSYHFLNDTWLRNRWQQSNTQSIRMMGGGGEIYRDYYQQLFGLSKDNEEVFSEEKMRSCIYNTRNTDINYGDFWGAIEDKIYDTFSRLPGKKMNKKLDNHYLFFRNRYHFGFTNSPLSSGININPVLSLSLLKAARGLPQNEKSSGRVLFDVTKALSEKVAYHKYDKFDFIKLSQSQYHLASRYDDQTISFFPSRHLISSNVAKEPLNNSPLFAIIAASTIF